MTECLGTQVNHNHSVNSSSHSVNSDIAIQWEWSNFDPSQNPNPLTDYDKTLHNWLRPRDEHVTQNLCQSAVRERLAKYVKYNASLFEVTRAWNFTRDGSKHALWRKEVPFGGPHDDRQHFGVQIPPKPSKSPSVSMFESPRTDSRRMTSQKTDVIGLHSLGGRAAYTIYSILEITAAVYFSIFTTQRLCQLMHYIRYGNSIFCKIYTVFVGNLFYRLARKKIPYAVCWKLQKLLKLWWASGGH